MKRRSRCDRSTIVRRCAPRGARRSRLQSCRRRRRRRRSRPSSRRRRARSCIDLDARDGAEPDRVFHEARRRGRATTGRPFTASIKYGMVQGGDPLTKDPAKRALYGTGGLNAVKAEARAPKMTRGSVAAVLVPGQTRQRRLAVLHRPRRSAGARQSVHRVRARRRTASRCCRRSPRRRWTTKASPPSGSRSRTSRFATRRPSRSSTRPPQELGALSRGARHQRRADHDRVLRRQGAEYRPPVHAARRGRRLQRHGVPSRRAGLRHSDRRARRAAAAPLTEKQQALVHNLPPEFNDTKHVKGIVSMARGDAPDSATTSFFIAWGLGAARRRLHGVRASRRRHGRRSKRSKRRREPARPRTAASI